jgi:hypothetical protein
MQRGNQNIQFINIEFSNFIKANKEIKYRERRSCGEQRFFYTEKKIGAIIIHCVVLGVLN